MKINVKVGDIVLINDELKIYRGEDYIISKYIKIHQPSLADICEYGEQEYYSMISHFTATPQSMKVQLWDIGIDYTQITPFALFYNVLYKTYPREKTSILFGDLDFTLFKAGCRHDNGEPLLFQTIADEMVVIDEYTYNMITDYLRQVHIINKDERLPANEATKKILIEDDREELERSKNKEYHSQLKNLISSMINCEGFKYNHSQVWDMKINAFMDSVQRVSKIKNAALLLQSGYSGFGINLKDIDAKQLDWLGDLR